MTGHGGDKFIKFQDQEEISSVDLADAIQQMYKQHRYNEILFMVDTCQAGTLHQSIYSPNVVAIGSSKLGENSYSHHADNEIGVSVIDRFTYYTLDFFEKQLFPKMKQSSAASTTITVSVHDLFSAYKPRELASTPDARHDLFNRSLATVPITDFFGAVSAVYATPYNYPLSIPVPQSVSVPTPSLVSDTVVDAFLNPRYACPSSDNDRTRLFLGGASVVLILVLFVLLDRCIREHNSIMVSR